MQTFTCEENISPCHPQRALKVTWGWFLDLRRSFGLRLLKGYPEANWHGAETLMHCRATSILASTEDARLEALRSLTAAVAVAYRGSSQPPAGLPVVSAAADALSRALMPVLAHVARGQSDTAGVAFSWLSSSTAAAAEVSQVRALARTNISIAYCHPPYMAHAAGQLTKFEFLSVPADLPHPGEEVAEQGQGGRQRHNVPLPEAPEAHPVRSSVPFVVTLQSM